MKCRHFGLCGGCATQDLEYPLQLERKQLAFSNLLEPFLIKPEPIVGAPDPWFYRNKVELSFGMPAMAGQVETGRGGDGGYQLGFKEKGKWYKTFNLEECLIFDPQIGAIARTIREWAAKENLPLYNQRSHQGFLRNLVIRKSSNGAFIIMPVTTSFQELPKQSLINFFNSHPISPSPHFFISLLWGIQDAWADTAQPQRFEIIRGRSYLEENLSGFPFRYSVMSFFQTNPKAFEFLLNDLVKIVSNLALSPPHPLAPSILDLYCGVGTIGITLAEKLGVSVLGVESAPSGIEDARFNEQMGRGGDEARGRSEKLGSGDLLSPILNFILSKVEDVAKELLEQPQFREHGVVVIDPPRSGLHPKVLKAFLGSAPRYLIYVCCNPDLALAREFPALSQIYKIVSARAYDFFPHTRHYEALLVLERKG